jgi:hypothetical protein
MFREGGHSSSSFLICEAGRVRETPYALVNPGPRQVSGGHLSVLPHGFFLLQEQRKGPFAAGTRDVAFCPF